MSYDKESSTLRKETYNHINQQVSNFEMQNNDYYLEGNDPVNPINIYCTKSNSTNNGNNPPFGLISQQIIQQSNHKPTLISHQFVFDDDINSEKGNINYMNSQINHITQNQHNYQQHNMQNNQYLPLYQFGNSMKNVNDSAHIPENNNLNIGIINNVQGQIIQQQQNQQHNQNHLQMNFNSNVLGNNYHDMMDQFQNFEEIKNNDNEYCLNSENTSSEDANANNNNNFDNNNNQSASDKQYICEYEECKKVFKAKKSLRDHLRIHTNQRPYSCQEPNCGKSFVQYSSLQKHSRTHKGDRPYKCDYYDCDQAFTQVSNLKRHQKIHLNDKPYECNQCLRKFTTSSNLKQHQITHESQKQRQRFKCQIDECGKSYLYSSSLKKHEKEHILNSNPKGPLLANQTSTNKSINEHCEMHGNKVQKHLKVNNNIHSDEVLEEEEEDEEEEELLLEDEEQDEEDEEILDEDEEEIYNQQKFKNLKKKENLGEASKGNQLNNQSNLSDSSNSNGEKVQKLQKKKIQNENNLMNTVMLNNRVSNNQSNQSRINTEEIDMLSQFFNSHHIALQHDGHYDVLFKGYLYHYNKKSGKIEIHDIQAQDEIKKGTCQPLSELTHNTFEDVQKKINEIEYRYNDTEILNNACNPLSCKCAINGSKGCCSSENGGSSSCNCATAYKQDQNDIRNKTIDTLSQIKNQGGCCSSLNQEQNISHSNGISAQSNQNQFQSQQNNIISEVVCCNEPNCTIDNIVIVSGTTQKDSCCQQPKSEGQNYQQSNISIERSDESKSCCQSNQFVGQSVISQNNKLDTQRQKSQQNDISQIKTEDCCCMIDQVKVECTCVGCDEDCQSCSKSTKCYYKRLQQKEREQNNLQNSTPSNQKQQNTCCGQQNTLQNEIKSSQQDNCINQHIHLQNERQIQQIGNVQYEIIEPKESINNNENSDEIKKQPKCICNDTKDLKHFHGPNCGHMPIYHHGHLDYIVENQLHHPHGGHCDFHGTVNVLDNIVKI